MMIYCYVVAILAMMYASYTDFKTRKIRIWLFPLMLALTLPVMALAQPLNVFFLTSRLVAAGFSFSLFYFFAKYCKGGGGDIIMTTCMAMLFGSKIFFAGLIFSSLAVFVFMLFMVIFCVIKKRQMIKFFPFAPFFMVGMILGFFIN